MSPPQDLQTFINQLESANELARVKCEVDPYLEVAAVVDRVCKQKAGGQALLFENVKGSSVPLAVNLFGSMKRMAICFGVDGIDSLAKKLAGDLSTYQDISSDLVLKQLVEKVFRGIEVDTFINEIPGRTECRLSDLPVLQSWPGDGGKYLTLAQVFTSLPGDERQNCGMYRIQLIDDDRLLLRCHQGSGGAKHPQARPDLD